MKILIFLSLLITLITALRVNNKQALAQLITSQIRTRIQSDLVFKISASLETSQGVAQIQQRHISAIQTAEIAKRSSFLRDINYYKASNKGYDPFTCDRLD
ncbi:hypothetical protein AB4K20DRAFT_1863358 [Rhizopus microsporus]|uniref:Secreted protein n=1 Tax=Rhizopus microsporus TaxID=58291 RepID=A0A1X0S1E0_RHIZD|nr:hypothetical protein BCV71DRAFT_235267 [Rhizopus microsporus]